MPFPANINLASLDGTTGFRIVGPDPYDRTGFSVASAGDVNGDGIDDVIIGSARRAGDTGGAFVVFGSRTPFGPSFDLSDLDGTNGFRLTNPEAGAQFGYSVASAGDINGDGIDDLIIGAPSSNLNGAAAGVGYVVFGRSTGFDASIDITSLDVATGFRILGLAAGDGLGLNVASAGDINHDGIDDLIIGAPRADQNGSDTGAAYVVFGRNTGFAADLDLGALDGTDGFRIDGPTDGDLGGRVASAGDINGDGIDDLVIGAPSADLGGLTAGAAFVVFGSATPFGASLSLADLDGSNGFRISGRAAGDMTGASVAAAGDINGDGIGDLIIGAQEADPNGDRSGASYVVFGGNAGFAANLDLASLDGTNGFRIAGLAIRDYNGRSVAGAGDINGDGLDDLIVSSPLADPNGTASGASYVIFGSRAGFASDFDLTTLNGTNGFKLSGVRAPDFSGYSVASAGDLNGDGVDDLIVGAVRAREGGLYSGSSYIIYGQVAEVIYTGTAGDDVADGGAADDQLSGLDGEDILSGLGGDDLLDGGNGKDALYGGDGADDLVGGAGGDLLDGGTGIDQMAGGLGDDTYIVDDASDAVIEAAGEGQDRILSSVNYTARANVENLQLTGSANINGSGNALDNQLDGNGGANNLSGNGGNDLVRGHGGDDNLYGDDGNDQLLGGDGSDALRGGAGADRLQGEAGIDYLYGGDGVDILDGGADGDFLNGDAGNDQLNGGDGADVLAGGDGNDVLIGGAGIDNMTGALGDDTYFVEAGDIVREYANQGTDTVRSAGDWTLGAYFERLVLDGAADTDGTGNTLANQITGNSGANVLRGMDGADVLKGLDGDDRLIGGLGGDVMVGGAGADAFVVLQESVVLSSAPGGRTIEVDTVNDLIRLEGDYIDLSAIDAVASTAGVDEAFMKVDAFNKQAGQMTLTFSGGVTLLQLDVDGDGRADYRMKIVGDVTGDSGNWLL